jgi:uncharacterized pyridoxal phosphate-dependent enzyme
MRAAGPDSDLVATTKWGEIYRDIGVKPVINAAGNIAVLGGPPVSPVVRAAMDTADEAFAPLEKLQERAGALIAQMLGVEGTYLSAGAGAAIVLSTEACMAGAGQRKIHQVPDVTGINNRFLLQKRQRHLVDRCLTLAGGQIVEFGDDDGTTEEQLESALGSCTAAVYCRIDEGHLDARILTLRQVIRIAHRRSVPVIVDAADQVFPIENLSKYARWGADLVAYGGMHFGAPDTTGLLVGSRDMIRKATIYGQVRHAACRREIIGLVVALREWLAMDHEARLADLERRGQVVCRHLSGIPGVRASLVSATAGSSANSVRIEVDPVETRRTAAEVVRLLKDGDPAIWTTHVNGMMTVRVNQLAPGQDEIVGRRLSAVFRA